ncbi:ketopantoate reductase family protein [Desertimonas flava]|uniref:ketopantoate reductase family protein n=1 Tax=Desertimonas flava TaxID=2064846 RepID=UPI0013C41057|nr:2-dehydropantoate 2-reductase [Desertimonas flava]
MTRFVIFGAGGVGGTIGVCLAEAGHDVVLVARGANRDAIAARGLRLETPERAVTVPLPVTDDVSTIGLGAEPGDVVLLATKSQDTAGACQSIAAAAANPVPVVCLQNGVANEAAVLRWFPDVYGVPVMLPALHLEPGIVQASSAPITGILDVGRYPAGVDDTAKEVSAAFAGATFDSEARPDVMAWKWRKLFSNCLNAVEALTGALTAGSDETVEVIRLVSAECERVTAAAGIDVVSRQDDVARRGDLMTIAPVNGADRPGGSTWQSLARGTGVETDYLNGEIVMHGRLHGVPTPVNEWLQHAVRTAAATGAGPGSMTISDVLAALRTVL